MPEGMSALAARPRTIAEVLDAVFRLVGLSVLKTLPYGILMTLVAQLGNIHSLLIGRKPHGGLPRDPVSMLLFLVSLAALLILWAALLLRQRAIAHAQTLSMREELKTGITVLPALMTTSLLIWIGTALGLLALVLPGIFLAVAWSLAPAILIFSNRQPLSALKHSMLLIRGHWWRTLCIYLVILIVLVVFFSLCVICIALIVHIGGGTDVALVWASTAVLVIALNALANPCIAALVVVVLEDLEARRHLTSSANA